MDVSNSFVTNLKKNLFTPKIPVISALLWYVQVDSLLLNMTSWNWGFLLQYISDLMEYQAILWFYEYIRDHGWRTYSGVLFPDNVGWHMKYNSKLLNLPF